MGRMACTEPQCLYKGALYLYLLPGLLYHADGGTTVFRKVNDCSYELTRRTIPGYANLRLMPINPLNPELNPICYLLALLGDHHFLHVSRIRVKLLTFRRLMSYIYGAPILDVSRSHTTTQRSR